MRRGYKWVDRELAGLDPATDRERVISLYVGYRIPEFALAATLCPGTMGMMRTAATAATPAHTGKLTTRPGRRFRDADRFLTAWMVDGLSSEAGRAAADRLNRIRPAIAGATPHLPGDFDDTGDFVRPLVLLAPYGDRQQTSLGPPGTSGPMKTACHRWAQTLFRLLERESGPLADERFPEDWDAMTEFAEKFDARPHEPTEAGHAVATAMTDHFAERWFPVPLRAFGRS
ncbi:DUF2236 domain-containing protein [Streptomyces sp. NPDC086777]|uniref:DUF2236 domain-containing protein n=1 Tax=Streptomyces sp. NPDC086777 TaxID=3154866 RepID=UPI00344C34B9